MVDFVKLANRDDLPELLRMGQEFTTALERSFDQDSATETLENLMDDDNGFLIITEGGMLGGVVYPSFLDKSVLIAQELFWWVDESVRGNGAGDAMLALFEAWGHRKDAKQVIMVAMHKLAPEKVGKLYQNKGYGPFEYSYVKDL